MSSRHVRIGLICPLLLLLSLAFLSPVPVAAAPALAINTNGVSFTDPTPGGNHNGIVDAGEAIHLTVTLVNTGNATATNIQTTLSTTTANVTVTTANAPYPDITAGGTGSNTTAFVVTTTTSYVCGTPIDFSLTVSFTGSSPTPLTFTLNTSVTPTTQQTSYTGARVPIPDGNATGVNIPLTVTQTGAIGKVVFNIDGATCTAAQGATTVGLDHSWVGDLTLTLTDPAGTVVSLMNRPGGVNNSGNNFCKTVLSDSGATSIQDIAIAGAPWQGTFKPNSPLAGFNNDTISGTWILHVVDSVTVDTGSVRSWSLTTTSAQCTVLAPTAADDTYTAPANTLLTVPPASGVLSNDRNPTGTTLTATQVTPPSHASSFTLNGDGSFSYTPTAGYSGPDSFTYSASSDTATSNTAMVTLTVGTAVPVATDDTYSTPANTPLTVIAPGVLTNDSGAPSPTAINASIPSRGTVTLNTDGSFTYTPTTGFTGSDSFTYQATNSEGTSTAATVSITVAPVAPVATTDSYSIPANTGLVVTAPGVLANDSGVPPPTAINASTPAHGAVTLNTDGSFQYFPTTGYTGPDSFTYQATNGAGTSTAATVTIAIGATAPVANADSYTTPANMPLTVAAPGVLTNDSGNPAPTAINASLPAHGTVTLNTNGSFTYTPTTGYIGSDSFTYQATNSGGTSAAATVTLTVGAAAPVATADAYFTPANTKLTVAAPGVLTNDTGAPSPTAINASTASHGVVTLNSDGSFSYTPAAAYVGTDSFTYQATSSAGTSAAATVTITVLSVAPAAIADSYNTPASTALTVPAPGVLANDAGTPAPTAINASTPAHGAVTLNTNGSFTYTPTTGYVGLDSFTYQATNSAGTSPAATVTIGVGATAPVATPDAYTATAGIPLTINAPGVLLNDTGIPAPTATKVSDPGHGTLIFNANGSFTYTAAASYVGSDSFIYTASNSGGTSAPVTVTITVIAAPLTSITLNGPNGSTNPSGKIGETVQLTATGTYQNNATQPLPGTQVTWSTSNAAIATVDANGVVTALTPGTVTITAKVGNVTQTITITITPATLSGVVVPPAPSGRPGGTTNPPAGTPAPAPVPSAPPTTGRGATPVALPDGR